MDLSFAYANARVKGMKSNLLTRETVRKLLDVQTLDEMVEILEETPTYKADFVAASTTKTGLGLMMTALQDNFSKTLNRLHHLLPDSAKTDFDKFLLEYEVADVKTHLASRVLSVPFSLHRLYNVHVHPGLLHSLEKAATWEECVFILSHYKDYASVASAAKNLELTNGNPANVKPVFDALDAMVVTSMLGLATREHHYLSKIVHARLERQDAMLALRLLREQTPAKDVRAQLLLPSSPAAERALSAPNYETAVKAVGAYFTVPEAFVTDTLQTKSLVPIEIGLEQTYVRNVFRSSRLAVLSFATIIGFLFLKKVEVDNIRRIALGKHFHVEDEMKRTVFAVNQ